MQNQKGVSLIITFFVLTIILAVVLSISVILYSQLKIVRNIGNSVVAFYAADSGTEKLLYYDRKVLASEDLERGLCTICQNGSDPAQCPLEHDTACSCLPLIENDTDGCKPDVCNNCEINFDTSINSQASYHLKAVVAKNDDETGLTIDSNGTYKGVKRQIEIFSKKIVSSQGGPEIVLDDTYATPVSVPNGSSISIQARVKKVGSDVDASSVKAHIQATDGVDIAVVALSLASGDVIDGTYTGSWSGAAGSYYVDVEASDSSSPPLKSTANNIPPLHP